MLCSDCKWAQVDAAQAGAGCRVSRPHSRKWPVRASRKPAIPPVNGFEQRRSVGPPGGYSVLYLGRPHSSIVIEAYRHLVDPFADAGMTGEMVAPRRLLICEVSVTEILDLRTEEARRRVGLTMEDLTSEVDDYEHCQMVGRVAHQLGIHGVLAPAATRFVKHWHCLSDICPRTNCLD